MIGTILLIILCVLLLLLLILLFTPIQARIAYDQGDFSARVRFGPLNIPLYPREKQAEDKNKTEKEKKEKPQKEEAKKTKLKINKEQILYSAEKLPPILGRALRRTGKRVCIKPLKLHLLIAGEDPADTALLYGKLEAALAVGLPALHRLVRIKDQDIRLFLDFQKDQIDCIADIGIVVRIWDLLVIALCAGASALKWLIEVKKLAAPAVKTDTTPPGKTSGKEQDKADAA